MIYLLGNLMEKWIPRNSEFESTINCDQSRSDALRATSSPIRLSVFWLG